MTENKNAKENGSKFVKTVLMDINLINPEWTDVDYVRLYLFIGCDGRVYGVKTFHKSNKDVISGLYLVTENSEHLIATFRDSDFFNNI